MIVAEDCRMHYNPLPIMSVNRVILVGNVGGKPEMRYIGELLTASFSLATNERVHKADDSSETVELTEWHNIVMKGRNAQIAERYIDKGTKLYVEGKLRTRTWQDRNAIKRNVTEIIVEYFEILSRPNP